MPKGVGASVEEVVKDIRRKTRRRFSNPRTGRRWSHWALRENWLKAAKRAGVEAGLYEGTKHSFATAALDRTRNERAVQEYLGHRDVRSTRRYAKLKNERLLDVVRPRTLH